MRYIFVLLALLAFPAIAADLDPERCHLEVPCQLGTRSYHVKEPDGWDGTSPLPVLIHFHGWQRTGALPVQHQRISGATRRRGVLLIAPNGQRKTWNMWSSETEDVQFAADVLEDVRARYPVDGDNIYVSGYSYGSIMAWRVACDRGASMNIRALLGISGTLRRSATCPELPEIVRHVHGLADTVLNFPFGPNGEPAYAVALWLDKMGCAAQSDTEFDWSVVDFLTLTRRTWRCDLGDVVLDAHPGGHFIPHGWIGRQLDELMDRTPSYP